MQVGTLIGRALVQQQCSERRRLTAVGAPFAYGNGHTATGKRRDRDAGPIETEQRAVARIVELRRSGRFYREIATALDVEGHRPAGRFLVGCGRVQRRPAGGCRPILRR